MISSFEITLKIILWMEIYSWGHGLVKRSVCGWSPSPLLGKVQALWICSLSLSSIRHHYTLELYKKIIFSKGFIFNTAVLYLTAMLSQHFIRWYGEDLKELAFSSALLLWQKYKNIRDISLSFVVLAKEKRHNHTVHIRAFYTQPHY